MKLDATSVAGCGEAINDSRHDWSKALPNRSGRSYDMTNQKHGLSDQHKRCGKRLQYFVAGGPFPPAQPTCRNRNPTVAIVVFHISIVTTFPAEAQQSIAALIVMVLIGTPWHTSLTFRTATLARCLSEDLRVYLSDLSTSFRKYCAT